jgi:hypothetical protein
MIDSLTPGDLTLRHIPAYVVPAEVGPRRSILRGLDLATWVHPMDLAVVAAAEHAVSAIGLAARLLTGA